jgi:hypothetical protein
MEKPADRSRKKKPPEVWWSDAQLLMMDDDVNRYVERWLGRVTSVGADGQPRRLTKIKDQIRDCMKFVYTMSRRERANYRRRRECARRKRARKV